MKKLSEVAWDDATDPMMDLGQRKKAKSGLFRQEVSGHQWIMSTDDVAVDEMDFSAYESGALSTGRQLSDD